MEMRDFLPGEPVVGDVVLCVDDDFTVQTRAKRLKHPRKGCLYKVCATSDERHHHWGFHDVISLNGQNSMGDFNRKLNGLYSAFRFRATHDPQVDWSKAPYANVLKDEGGKNNESVKTRHLLWQARQCMAWRELYYSNVGLALALVVLHPWASDDPASSLANLTTTASMQRLDLCRLLGFPATSSVLRVLSRLHQSWGQALDHFMWPLEGRLLGLRQLLNHEPCAADLFLRHEAISHSHFKRLAFGFESIGPFAALEDGPETQRGSWFFRLPMAQRHWLTAEFELLSIRERNTRAIGLLPRRRSIGTFQREKDAVAHILKRKRLLDDLDSTIRDLLSGGGPRSWPEPPLPGSDLIKPITSKKELVEEGKQLRHCIATYADHIAVGVYFAYRMSGPTRCTVGVKWKGQRWVLDPLHGGANSSIKLEQMTMVDSWIDSHPEHAASLRSNVAKEICRLIRTPKRPRPRLATVDPSQIERLLVSP